jgi:type VI secretion system protein ImpC
MAEETETAQGAAAGEGSLLERIMVEGKLARDQSQREYARDLVGEFVNEVLAGATVSNDVVDLINDKIAEIDDLLSAQVNEILHHAEFQKLEASWRGLSYLVFNTETSSRLKLRLLNITKGELLKDLEKAVEFDQSALFKKVYE